MKINTQNQKIESDGKRVRNVQREDILRRSRYYRRKKTKMKIKIKTKEEEEKWEEKCESSE